MRKIKKSREKRKKNQQNGRNKEKTDRRVGTGPAPLRRSCEGRKFCIHQEDSSLAERRGVQGRNFRATEESAAIRLQRAKQRDSHTEDRLRRWSRKILSSPPLISTPKSQLFAEQPSMKKPGTYQDRSSTSKYTQKKPQGNWQEGQTCNIVKSHISRWATHKLKNNYISEVLPQD